MKRNLLLFLIIILAIVAGYVFFTRDEITFSKETSGYKAVPVTAPLFVEFKSLQSFDLKNTILQESERAGIEIPAFNLSEQLDSIIKNDKEIENGLRNEPFIIAFGLAGKNYPVPLFIKKAGSQNKRKAIEQLLMRVFPKKEYLYKNRNYNGQKITAITLNPNKVVLHFSFSEGLFIASSKAILVEQAIRQISTESILNNRNFTKVSKTVSSQSEISWFVNHKQFSTLLSNWVNPKSKIFVNEFGETVKQDFRKKVEVFSDFASWSELDVNLNGNKISLNGISTADDSLNHFLSVFNNQEAVRFAVDKVLPKNTSFFVSFAFSNKEQFFENLENYFLHSDSYYKREQHFKKMGATFRIDFKETLKELVKDEVTVATTAVPANPDDKTTLFILHTEGQSAAVEKLQKMLADYANRKKIDVNSLSSTFAVDADTHFPVFRFPYPSFPGVWLGQPFTLAQANYVAFYGNFMVFSNSEKGLKEYLRSMVLKATLVKDMQYLRFKQNIENKTNINIYLNVNRAFSLNKEILNADVSKGIAKNEPFFRKFQAVNWQVVRDKEIFFNSIFILFNQKAKEEAKTIWQSNIGSGIDSKPQLVINHNDPGNREIILQDSRNKLHLINRQGRVLWSVPLQEPIISKIYQIDYFKNGKLQYLFNTKSKLYLLDRNGNNVAKFPIVFRSPATNGVNVFDYDNNRKYRYFVACENRKVYAYDYSGKIIAGWKFGKTDYPVTTPVQFFRVAGKDYIVFKDQSRIYIQNRQGQTRVKTKARFKNSRNQLILNLNGRPKIVATDKAGNVFYIYFDGKYTEKKIGKFSENHFFTVADLNGNGIPDFVFVDGNELEVTDENGKKLFSKKFKNTIRKKPNIYTFSKKLKKVGVVDAASNRIYLFNPDGKLHEGFPLQGNSEFTIGKISKNAETLNLIVGSEGGDLFNYSLN